LPYDRTEAGGAPSTQGDNVSSSVWHNDAEDTWYLQGHYGSSGFDCDRYRFVKNFPSTPANPVCDDCIRARLVAGDLVQVPGNFL
jgi:hypothetical protein